MVLKKLEGKEAELMKIFLENLEISREEGTEEEYIEYALKKAKEGNYKNLEKRIYLFHYCRVKDIPINNY